jgi:hypothetical protein
VERGGGGTNTIEQEYSDFIISRNRFKEKSLWLIQCHSGHSWFTPTVAWSGPKPGRRRSGRKPTASCGLERCRSWRVVETHRSPGRVPQRSKVRWSDDTEAPYEVASSRLAAGSALMLPHFFASELMSPSARERVRFLDPSGLDCFNQAGAEWVQNKVDHYAGMVSAAGVLVGVFGALNAPALVAGVTMGGVALVGGATIAVLGAATILLVGGCTLYKNMLSSCPDAPDCPPLPIPNPPGTRGLTPKQA